jgi:hypothetical protein
MPARSGCRPLPHEACMPGCCSSCVPCRCVVFVQGALVTLLVLRCWTRGYRLQGTAHELTRPGGHSRA